LSSIENINSQDFPSIHVFTAHKYFSCHRSDEYLPLAVPYDTWYCVVQFINFSVFVLKYLLEKCRIFSAQTLTLKGDLQTAQWQPGVCTLLCWVNIWYKNEENASRAKGYKKRTQNCLIFDLWPSWVALTSNQHSCGKIFEHRLVEMNISVKLEVNPTQEGHHDPEITHLFIAPQGVCKF
jgi:hypothetical protein